MGVTMSCETVSESLLVDFLTLLARVLKSYLMLRGLPFHVLQVPTMRKL